MPLNELTPLAETRADQERGAKGRRIGEARILRSLPRLRFGELPDPVHQRLDTADADTRLRGSARVLTAPNLATVFDDGEPE